MELKFAESYFSRTFESGFGNAIALHQLTADLDQALGELDLRPGQQGEVALDVSVQLHALATQMRQSLSVILDSAVAHALETIRMTEAALRLDGVLNFDQRLWQLVLVSLGSELRSLGEVFHGEARKTLETNELLCGAWPKDWDERFAEIDERIDDLMETIALGLNDETREEIADRINRIIAGDD